MIREQEELSRTLKRTHVACRQATHDLGWICAVLAESGEPNRGEIAREASLQVADELEEIARSLRVACGADPE